MSASQTFSAVLFKESPTDSLAPWALATTGVGAHKEGASLCGAANYRKFIVQSGLKQSDIYLYEEGQKTLVASFERNPAKKEMHLAFQPYKKTSLDFYRIEQTNDTIDIKKEGATRASFSARAAELCHALCLNFDADLRPDTFLLLKGDKKLFLYLIPQSDFSATKKWRCFSIPSPPSAEAFFLVPSVWVHSMEQLEIVAKENGTWRSLKTFLPRDFIAPFSLESQDFKTVWMKDTGMTRAEAKVLWNAGGRHIGALRGYLESLWGGAQAEKESVSRVLLTLDPNRNKEAARLLASRFVKWLQSDLGPNP